LIRRARSKPAYGLVYPLITKADGTKFGKTESGTVWLSAERTSPYRFYQFWLNTDDKDIVNYLKLFTFLGQDEIAALAAALAEKPEERVAQRTLAREMTRLLHGQTALDKAEQASQALFGGEMSGLSAADIQDIFAEVPSSELPASRLEGVGLSIVDLMVASGMAKSKGEARRSIAEGGINLNNRRASDATQAVTLADAIEGRFLVLRKGRKNYTLVKILY
jgi:tyrosyl-tRNA synthetase